MIQHKVKSVASLLIRFLVTSELRLRKPTSLRFYVLKVFEEI